MTNYPGSQDFDFNAACEEDQGFRLEAIESRGRILAQVAEVHALMEAGHTADVALNILVGENGLDVLERMALEDMLTALHKIISVD